MLTKPEPTKHRNRAEEKQLERMRLAREERERKNAMFNRGEPKIDKKYQHSMETWKKKHETKRQI